ncbi:TetR/AcrR family transcriptional regulator [Streptacidiphilus rugosus]|uniref:TetR/AcrR family transcriptional regulator n=1 Tax=Streptacidiphilus rugosus TaxID=405783 RepID=UPI00056A12CB|nr:TetR/AcrR family transcriptional regulator [Streptacidiphilus rugosus]
MSEASDVRRRILNGAYAAFCLRTYAGAQMPFIAELAKAGTGSIYRYFPGKEELGNAAYQDAITDLLARQRKIHAARHPSIRAEFAQAWQGYADFASERTAAFHFLSQDNSAFLNDDNQALQRAIYALGADFIQRGQDAGRIRPGDPGQLLALTNGAFFRWAGHAYPTPVNDLPQSDRETAEDACWHILQA